MADMDIGMDMIGNGPGGATVDQGQGNNIGAGGGNVSLGDIVSNLGASPAGPVFGGSYAQELAISAGAFTAAAAIVAGAPWMAGVGLGLTIANLPTTLPFVNAMSAQIGQDIAQTASIQASAFNTDPQGFAPSFSAGIQ